MGKHSNVSPWGDNVYMLAIYVKGYCSKKYKSSAPSGSAFLIADDKQTRAFVSTNLERTANRAELLAAIKALNCLKDRHFITIYSNLDYLVFGMRDGRSKRITKAGEPVANLDLWQQLDEAVSFHYNVRFARPRPNDPHMLTVEERAFEAAHKLVTP